MSNSRANEMRVLSGSAAKTREIAERIGECLSGPLAFSLRGEYGAGKTTFTQGLAIGLGIAGPVRSPSYNILKTYKGRLQLVHVDLYRTKSPAEIEELGIEEVSGPDAVVAVEWPGELSLDFLGCPVVIIEFSTPDGGSPEPDERVLDFSLPESGAEGVREALSAFGAG